MTKTLLFLTLMLVAPVAGAYQGFHCKDCTLTDVHTNQDQPAEEAKQSEAEKWKDKCEEYLNIIDKPLNSKGAVRSIDAKQMYANLANAYCTRAILEEMRNN